MKDNKKALNEIKDELSEAADKIAVNEDNFGNAVDKSAEYSSKALDDELQRLAATFKQELEKAQAMTEEELIKNGIIIQQFEDEEGIIPQEELCQCCGEQRRDKAFGENYEYCRACREAMKRYPLSIYSLVLLAASVFVAVVSIFSFAADYKSYDIVRKADKYLSESKLDSAFEAYDSAIEAFNTKELLAKKLYLRTTEIMFDSMPDGIYSMSEIQLRIKKALTQMEINLPLYNKYEDIYTEAQVMYATMDEFYNVVYSEEYAEFDGKDTETYEAIMTDIGAIIDKQVTVVSVDGKTSQMVASSQPMVRFCQYMFAYSMGKFADSYQYMKEVYELEPSYVWLYAYELGMAELQNGNSEEAEALAEIIYLRNKENPDSYVLRSSIARMSGNTKKAVSVADEGIAMASDYPELYRIKAMAYIVKGDLESAQECVNEGLKLEEYSFMYMVSLVVENELGNKDNVKQIKAALEEQEVELTEKMEKYLKGKITAEQMFTEGTGDVE